MDEEKMRKVTLALAIMSLAGCGTFADFSKPDGRTWSATSCSGFTGWDACHKKAGEACPNGYDIANKEENQATGHRSMLYSCKR